METGSTSFDTTGEREQKPRRGWLCIDADTYHGRSFCFSAARTYDRVTSQNAGCDWTCVIRFDHRRAAEKQKGGSWGRVVL